MLLMAFAHLVSLRAVQILKGAVSISRGGTHSIRREVLKTSNKGKLTALEQARCLIDLATDKRVLSRTWWGWSPWL